MTTVLVTGGGGQLGYELTEQLLQSDFKVAAPGHESLDITQSNEVESVLRELMPALIINAAAYTDVDGAEEHEKEAYAINALGPKILAAQCNALGVPLIHVSTDYVFGQMTGQPHPERETPRPGCAYARTKLSGEIFVRRSGCRHLVVRSCGLFGRRGRNFVKTMLRLGRTRDSVQVVADQLCNPTPARALAEALVQMGQVLLTPSFERYDVYHYAAQPACSWADFARAIFQRARELGLLDHEVKVEDISSAQYHSAAVRPNDSRLETMRCSAIFNLGMPHWQDYLDEVLLQGQEP